MPWYPYFMAGVTTGAFGVIGYAVLLRPRGWYEAAVHKCGYVGEFDVTDLSILDSKPCPVCGEYGGWEKTVIRKRIFRAIEVKS